VDEQRIRRRFVTTDDARERVSVSYQTLRRWMDSGLLKSYRPAGFRRPLIDIDELDQLVLASVEPTTK
jgi:excisionase family DNA binding protein